MLQMASNRLNYSFCTSSSPRGARNDLGLAPRPAHRVLAHHPDVTGAAWHVVDDDAYSCWNSVTSLRHAPSTAHRRFSTWAACLPSRTDAASALGACTFEFGLAGGPRYRLRRTDGLPRMPGPGQERVEHDRRMTRLIESRGCRRADVTRPAGDQNLPGRNSSVPR